MRKYILLLMICFVVMFGQIANAMLPFIGEDYLKGKSKLGNCLIIDGGVYNPILGMSAELIFPDVEGTYWGAKLTQSIELGDEPMGMLGGGGTALHLTWGTKLSQKAYEGTFFYTLFSSYGYNTITRTGYYIKAPKVDTTYFLVDVWLEPNGVYGDEKTASGVTYQEFEKGYNVYIVPKWRWMTEYNFRYDHPTYGSKYWDEALWFDIGPVLSADLGSYGLWFDVGVLLGDFYVDAGMGLIYKTNGPEYTSKSKASADDSLYMPLRCSLGWKIALD